MSLYVEAQERVTPQEAAILVESSGRILSMRDDMRTLPRHETGLGLDLHSDKVRVRK